MSSRMIAPTGALLIALAAPAAAQAVPTMDPLKPCYVTAGTAANPQAEGIELGATGFTPNSVVQLAIDGVQVPGGEALQTDQTGALRAVNPVPAPFIPSGKRQFSVTLTEVGNTANTVTAYAKTTALDVSVKPRRARPSQKIRFNGSGFTADAPVYAHYVFKNKLRKTVRMARRPVECGAWSARKVQIPVADPRPGLWTVQFDQSKKYRNGTKGKLKSVYVRLGISVTLVRG